MLTGIKKYNNEGETELTRRRRICPKQKKNVSENMRK